MDRPRQSSPLFIIAALSVILFSGAGFATLMGWLPGARSQAELPVAGTGPAQAQTLNSTLPASPAAAGVDGAPAPAANTATPAAGTLPANTPMPVHRKPQPIRTAEAGQPPPGSAPAAGLPPPDSPGMVGTPPPVTAPQSAAPPCNDCGSVRSVRAVETEGQGTGVGAVAGGVLGALVGNQVGRGNGNTLATIVGVGGGALAGNAVEKNVRKSVHWEVSVTLANGAHRVFHYSSEPAFRTGDAVRIRDGSLTLAN